MHLTPREIEKVLIYSLAEVALKRQGKGLKLNHPETVAIISAAAMDGARGQDARRSHEDCGYGPDAQKTSWTESPR